MRIEAVCFTSRGESLGERLLTLLGSDGDEVGLERCGGSGRPLREWVDDAFTSADALIFVGAAGIAVRALAGRIRSKTSDPAVVVVDDAGRFAIPILSGHIGGANDLASRVARAIGAVAVVTTATDAAGVFAVDVWARENGMTILNPERIKAVSAALLEGGEVRLRSEFPVAGDLPEGVVATRGECDVYVGIRTPAPPAALHLAPPAAVLGIGCRKGVSAAAVGEAFEGLCRDNNLRPEAFRLMCSIDLKKNEPGVIAFGRERGIEYRVYSPDELMRAEGTFAASAFVEAVAGVDTVCERAAVLGSGGGRLIVGKTAYGGVALAAAAREYALRFGSGGGDGA